MIHEYPAYFARFYDLIYKKQRDGVDSDFFLNEIKKTRGKILELGVGTGRFFIKALNAGADVYGIDISTSMTDLLKEKIEKEHQKRISVQNLINFELEDTFDLIIAPFRVFMHILNKEEQIHSLNHIYKYLNSNGRFIFDAFVPDLNQIIQGFHDYKDFDEEYQPGKRLKRYVSTEPDLINQIINVTFTLKWDEDDGFQKRKWNFPLRFFFRHELEHLIERSKFGKNFFILGDYQGNKLKNDSKEFILVCRKN
jgi:SAM-dependent methyltransferase